MISNDLLTKYSMAPLEDYRERHGDTFETEIIFYQTFLIQTDHIPNKIVERMLEDLAEATLVSFIEAFIRFIVSVKTEYKEVLHARKFAREKINELLGGTENETEK